MRRGIDRDDLDGRQGVRGWRHRPRRNWSKETRTKEVRASHPHQEDAHVLPDLLEETGGEGETWAPAILHVRSLDERTHLTNRGVGTRPGKQD